MSGIDENTLRSACMSFAHDYGLRSLPEQILLGQQGMQWLHAWQKEGLALQDPATILEIYWRPIAGADKTITFEKTFDIGGGKSMTIRNSDHYWVRDADGRIYEAVWSDHRGGYWWDLDGESPVDPVEYMPHPLSLIGA